MHKNKFLLIAFALVCLAQLYVPAKMIFEREQVLQSGKEYKFVIAPIDPNDPLRGKYISLRYKANTFVPGGREQWRTNESVYVILEEDKSGYARIKTISKTRPSDSVDFVKGKIAYSINNTKQPLTINYPFDRFYMEETKAPLAEKVYIEALADTSKVAYASVNIRHGEAVIKDVLIDGKPLHKLLGRSGF